MNEDARAEGKIPTELEKAWTNFMVAERLSLRARVDGRLAYALGEALPGESQEELDRMADEDRRLAREGLTSMMDEEGELYHKHVEELGQSDAADRVRAETALYDWLMSRTERRLEALGLPRLSRRRYRGRSVHPTA